MNIMIRNWDFILSTLESHEKVFSWGETQYDLHFKKIDLIVIVEAGMKGVSPVERLLQ